MNFIKQVILSEYLYYILGVNGGSSPKALRQSNSIKSVLATSLNELSVLADFNILSSNQNFCEVVPQIMSKYNLLPNDAIILAKCKLHGIMQLASHDTDFIIPCQEEGIELLRED